MQAPPRNIRSKGALCPTKNAPVPAQLHVWRLRLLVGKSRLHGVRYLSGCPLKRFCYDFLLDVRLRWTFFGCSNLIGMVLSDSCHHHILLNNNKPLFCPFPPSKITSSPPFLPHKLGFLQRPFKRNVARSSQNQARKTVENWNRKPGKTMEQKGNHWKNSRKPWTNRRNIMEKLWKTVKNLGKPERTLEKKYQKHPPSTQEPPIPRRQDRRGSRQRLLFQELLRTSLVEKHPRWRLVLGVKVQEFRVYPGLLVVKLSFQWLKDQFWPHLGEWFQLMHHMPRFLQWHGHQKKGRWSPSKGLGKTVS